MIYQKSDIHWIGTERTKHHNGNLSVLCTSTAELFALRAILNLFDAQVIMDYPQASCVLYETNLPFSVIQTIQAVDSFPEMSNNRQANEDEIRQKKEAVETKNREIKEQAEIERRVLSKHFGLDSDINTWRVSRKEMDALILKHEPDSAQRLGITSESIESEEESEETVKGCR